MNEQEAKLQSELAGLDERLRQEFVVERSLLAAGLRERVMSHLPRPATPLLRAARALLAMVLLAEGGCVALALLLTRSGWSPEVTFKLTVGGGLALLALLLAVAAPRLSRLDAWLWRRLTGGWISRRLPLALPGGLGELLVVRGAALLLAVLAGVVML